MLTSGCESWASPCFRSSTAQWQDDEGFTAYGLDDITHLWIWTLRWETDLDERMGTTSDDYDT